MLTQATRRTISDYAREKLWEPLGAEADASWSIDATGQEVTYAYFNAVLRDWARLGLMLAHDGMWGGRSIVPRSGRWPRPRLRRTTATCGWVAVVGLRLQPGLSRGSAACSRCAATAGNS